MSEHENDTSRNGARPVTLSETGLDNEADSNADYQPADEDMYHSGSTLASDYSSVDMSRAEERPPCCSCCKKPCKVTGCMYVEWNQYCGGEIITHVCCCDSLSYWYGSPCSPLLLVRFVAR